MSEQIINLTQTLSPTQSLDSGEGFFPDAPGVTLTDGTIMYTWRDDVTQDDPAGTGNFDPFLSIQKIGSGTATNFYNGSTHGTLDAIIAAAHTGKVGDGKIFVTSLEQVVRIRTSEEGVDAL